MRAWTALLRGMVWLWACVACSAAAGQTAPAGEMWGTVHLRSGKSLTGSILAAQFDPAGENGLGAMFEAAGQLRLRTAGGEVALRGTGIAGVELSWAEDGGGWRLASVTVSESTGQQVTGEPAWEPHVSYLKMAIDGEQQTLMAFPDARAFDPGKLIAKVVLHAKGQAPPPRAQTTEATAAPAGESRPVDPTPAHKGAQRPPTQITRVTRILGNVRERTTERRAGGPGRARRPQPTPAPAPAATVPLVLDGPAGTVRLRNGDTLTGKIVAAEFGVVPFARTGARDGGAGEIKLSVEGADVTIPGNELRSIDLEWKEPPEGDRNWRIERMTITKADGEQVIGKPTWLLHASYVKIITDGKLRRIVAFPLSRRFDPGLLAERVEFKGE
jgi:hypothetical protein